MLSRAIPAVLAGPIAGVLLDRLNRKQVMIASDIVRAVLALGFILTIHRRDTWLLYFFSALLMFASPFFTSGRSAILPSIATKDELHTANSLTQTTGWMTLTIGTFLGGASVAQFGYRWAFVGNALSFVFSAICISRLFLPGDGFRPKRESLTEADVVRPWHEYTEGLRYMRAHPLILGIALIGVGWATGGGAAQILFSVFGEIVFNRGPAGIGIVWGCAGIGLLIGGLVGHRLGERLSFNGYKRAVVVCYVIHGGAYVLFSQMRNFHAALVFIALSRAAVGVSSVLNYSQLLRHVANEFRARVRHHGVDGLVYHDGFDDARGNRIAALRSARDRRDCGRAQLDDGDFLGLGELDGSAARTGARGRRSGGGGSTWRTQHLVCRTKWYW
jgi:MFS family permease